MTLVDSHCHLDDPQFAGDLDAVIERALAAGVGRMLAVGTGKGPPDLEAGLRLAAQYPVFDASVGVHPHDASKAGEEAFARLEELAARPEVCAVGEIGLDYHYNFSPPEVQRAAFERQLEIAARAGKPVIIHTREAWDDTLALLGRWKGPGGVFHCFPGGEEEAREALNLGFHLGFGGVLTFPKAERVRAAARFAPLDRLLVETDAPYLAPVPHRGKRNEPAFVAATVNKLAGVRGQAEEAVAYATTSNYRSLFATGEW